MIYVCIGAGIALCVGVGFVLGALAFMWLIDKVFK